MKKQKGITLIALIITIVVLLILAGVTINAIQGDGIIGHAKDAKDTYTESQAAEEEMLLKYEYELAKANGTVTGGYQNYVLEKKYGISIGDYVDYTYDADTQGYSLNKLYSGYYVEDQTIQQTTDLKWRVLGVNDKGEIELISDSLTNNIVCLGNASGYNNGVYLLNDICSKQYSNSELGITARSLTIEDIEKQYSSAGNSVRDNYINTFNIKYGEIVSYNPPTTASEPAQYYPELFANEIGSGVTGTIRENGIGVSDAFYNSLDELTQDDPSQPWANRNGNNYAENGFKIKHLYYKLVADSSSYFENETFYNMIFKDDSNSKIWLASRTVFCDNVKARFSIRTINGLNLMCRDLFYSGDFKSTNGGAYLLPVVTIPSNISIVTNNNANSITNMWQLSK